MKFFGQDIWSLGICIERLENRSYMVKVGDIIYRCNCRYIQKINELFIVVYFEVDQVFLIFFEDNLVIFFDFSSEVFVIDYEENIDFRRFSCIC